LSTAPAIAILHRRRQTTTPTVATRRCHCRTSAAFLTPSRRQTPSNTVAAINTPAHRHHRPLPPSNATFNCAAVNCAAIAVVHHRWKMPTPSAKPATAKR